VRFATGGTQDEIDLNNRHATAFRKQLTPFVEHSCKTGRGQRHPRPAPSRQRSGDIRAWAKEHGIAVSGHGRIPARVAEQYEATTRGS
jgi:Lsr2